MTLVNREIRGSKQPRSRQSHPTLWHLRPSPHPRPLWRSTQPQKHPPIQQETRSKKGYGSSSDSLDSLSSSKDTEVSLTIFQNWKNCHEYVLTSPTNTTNLSITMFEKTARYQYFFVIAFLWIVEAAQLLFCHSKTTVLSTSSQIPTSNLLSLAQSGMVLHQIHAVEVKHLRSYSAELLLNIRWCPGHPCFLHQVRYLHQVFFLWPSLAWFCTRFKQWKWNCIVQFVQW